MLLRMLFELMKICGMLCARQRVPVGVRGPDGRQGRARAGRIRAADLHARHGEMSTERHVLGLLSLSLR